MIISYRYPIFPSREVEQKLVEALDTCRWLYNRLLEEINKARESGKTLRTYSNPRVGLAHNVGGCGGTAVVHILAES